MTSTPRPLALLALALAGLAAGGCANLGAHPWERGQLAREEMRSDNDPLETSFDEHVYFSKEASSGGRGFGGGGCGCN